ncbi:hypothetical protein [Paenibacillus naphthalenovorans]|uniref:hypothetical protein n=1 Tax=Paenibacillus naphthalenovorans TaxID=162209 RepID=UPI0008886C6A|nr:hypothetical protein [Paenibacillus naphthalenovorans]SDJ92975.1 hypothetical protein SAMN05421868_1599 [Paenibacillus naphthalenovorans]
MPELTPRLGIKKPLGNESVSRAAQNENYDIIDTNAAKKTDLDDHTAATTGIHGATSAATPNAIMQRDANGRAKAAAPAAADDIARKAEVDAVGAVANNALPKAGGTMTGALIADRDVNTNDTRLYQNLASYKDNGSPITGTIKIALPKTWSNTMMVIRIVGYDYSAFAAWELIVSGYNITTPAWLQYSAEVRGNAPFNQVRLAHDGTVNCILLGTTSTAWRYPHIAVVEMQTSYNNVTGWETGWNISCITSETGITNIVTPTLRKAWNSENDGAGSGLDADTVRGYVPVNKAGDTMTGDLLMSGVTRLIRQTNRTSRIVLDGADGGSASWGAHIVVEGNDYGGTGLGGNLTLTPGNGKKARIYDGLASAFYDIWHTGMLRTTNGYLEVLIGGSWRPVGGAVKVQRGQATIPAASNTVNVTVSSIPDLTKAYIIISHTGFGNGIRATLTSATNLELYRNQTSSIDTLVTWQIIEHVN